MPEASSKMRQLQAPRHICCITSLRSFQRKAESPRPPPDGNHRPVFHTIKRPAARFPQLPLGTGAGPV
eukprot:635734-Prorocentrum_minimum.AAC.1